MQLIQPVATDKAPAAIGPYSQALTMGGLVFVSGQLPLDARDRTMPEGIAEQSSASLNNLKAILESAGSSLEKVLKTTVYLADINDFAAVNEVYAAFFKHPYPARSCFAVKSLPMGAKIEIEAIAAR
ncbi:MAG: RidA family protein [Desulfovibrio sp.]|jgi:2-iminobutanoate/2-iminopropanoate deaminase|nr:RidA family protein [Desulfovibrio sp.]